MSTRKSRAKQVECYVIRNMAHRNTKKKSQLPEETIQAVIRLGEVLRPIAHRLIAEGKAKVKDGKLIFIKQ